MTKQSEYLVPVDFKENTAIALAYAAKLARESNAKLLLVHVIADVARGVPLYLGDQFFVRFSSLRDKRRAVRQGLLLPKSFVSHYRHSDRPKAH